MRRLICPALLSMAFLAGCGGEDKATLSDPSGMVCVPSMGCQGTMSYQSGPTTDEALAAGARRGLAKGLGEESEGGVTITVLNLSAEWTVSCPKGAELGLTGADVLDACEVQA